MRPIGTLYAYGIVLRTRVSFRNYSRVHCRHPDDRDVLTLDSER